MVYITKLYSSLFQHDIDWYDFTRLDSAMALPEQKKKLLKAKIAVALHNELGRVSKTEEIDQVFLLARVMYKAVDIMGDGLFWKFLLVAPSVYNNLASRKLCVKNRTVFTKYVDLL